MNNTQRAPALPGTHAKPGPRRGYVAAVLAVMVGMMMAAAPERPRDPWVFRCVLDKNPRMVVIALHEDLWVAYDAQTCSLYKVWSDGVNFDGAVYTTVHGPQPTSDGDALFYGPEGEPWQAHQRDGNTRSAATQWRGYRLENNTVWLRYSITHRGLTIGYEESVEVILDDDKPVGIERRFRQTDGPLGSAGESTLRLAIAEGKQVALSTITHDWSDRHEHTDVPLDDPDFEFLMDASDDRIIRMYFLHDETAGETNEND